MPGGASPGAAQPAGPAAGADYRVGWIELSAGSPRCWRWRRRRCRAATAHAATRLPRRRQRPGARQRLGARRGRPGDRPGEAAARAAGAGRLPVVGARAVRAGARPARAGLHRPPDRRRRSGAHQGRGDGREHPVLGVLGAGAVLHGCASGDSDGAGSWPPSDDRTLRGGACRARAALRREADGDRGLERARPGQRRLFRRSGKGREVRGAAARGVPGDQAGGTRRSRCSAARWWARTATS